MSKSNRPSGPVRGATPEPARKSIFVPVMVVVVLVGVGVLAVRQFQSSSTSLPPPTTTTVPETTTPPETRPVTTPQTPVVESTPTPPVVPPAAPIVAVPPAQLVSSLTQIDLRQPVSAHEAQAWKESLRQLVAQGPAAVPAIKEFLARNVETSFAPGNGAEQFGYPTLRAGFFDALTQIGGPEATSTMLQVMQSSVFPTDLPALEKGLNQLAPGQYQTEIVGAVRQQLFLAAQAPSLNDLDVGALFQVLANEGSNGAPIAQEVQQYGTKWYFYSAITLAGLPEGAGLPTLTQMAQAPEAGQGVALEAIAQMAATNPQALATLFELVRNGQIPDHILAGVAPFLGGQQFVLSSPSNPLPQGALVQNIHMASGNQNFTQFQNSAPAQIQQQIALIDQFLQVLPPSNATTIGRLQSQRNLLTAKLGR